MTWLKWLATALLVLVALGAFAPAVHNAAAPEARRALEDTGLGHLASGADHALHMDSHGGFHGDGCTITVLEIDRDAADLLWGALPDAEGWRITPVTLDEYAAMAHTCLDHPEVYPAPDTVFDAWYHREDDPGYNYTVAFFDRESRAFFYFRSDI